MLDDDIAVIGGGIIGTAIAWKLATAGRAVTVFDPAPGSGASIVAAGMLSVDGEVQYGETGLLPLMTAAAGQWPDFCAQAGADLGYRPTGSLMVGVDSADRAELARQARLQTGLGLDPVHLSGKQCRQEEPLLSPRRVHHWLWEAGQRLGVTWRAEQVTDISALPQATVVLAAGVHSAALANLPVHPVRGQVLRLRGPARLRQVIRALVGGRSVYLVPRADGEVVVGATSTERGFDTTPTAGDTHELLRVALAVVPELSEYELAETNVGLRPGTPDNAPLLGVTEDRRVIAATGHFRHGILLAPITAQLISELILTGRTPPLLKPFSPQRFNAGSGNVASTESEDR